MRTTDSLAALLAAALALGACGASEGEAASEARAASGAPGRGASVFAHEPDRRWRLPPRLREISGLATTPDGRLFGHDDEVGVLYELDIENGALVKAFALGDPVVRGDFEGLAITPEGDFYLVGSTGRLYRFREGEDGAHVAFATLDTGLRDTCEIEGLAFAPAERSLIVACKTNHARATRDTLALYAWSIRDERLAPWLATPAAPLAEAVGTDGLRPSGIEIDARSGRTVLLSARGPALLELDREGALLAARRLGRLHVQPEGATVLPDGSLAIADEGRLGRALLSRYPRAGE